MKWYDVSLRTADGRRFEFNDTTGDNRIHATSADQAEQFACDDAGIDRDDVIESMVSWGEES